MNFKRFSKIMAFSLAFPWVACMGGDNNGPDIYAGPAYNHNVSGRIPRYGVGSYSDSGMETDSGTHIFFTSELVYEEPVAGSLPSHCRATNVYFWQEGGVLWLSVPRSGLAIAPSQNGDLGLWSGAPIDGGPWNGLGNGSGSHLVFLHAVSTHGGDSGTLTSVERGMYSGLAGYVHGKNVSVNRIGGVLAVYSSDGLYSSGGGCIYDGPIQWAIVYTSGQSLDNDTGGYIVSDHPDAFYNLRYYQNGNAYNTFSEERLLYASLLSDSMVSALQSLGWVSSSYRSQSYEDYLRQLLGF